jgi:WD40 repeat protein
MSLPTHPPVPDRRQERWPLLAWAPAGNRVASCDRSNYVQIWDSRTGKLLLELDGGNSSHTRLAWSRGGDRIVLATEEAVTVWDAASGKPLAQTRNGVSASYASFSANLERGVLASGVGQLELWPPLTLPNDKPRPVYVAWTPDDRVAAWDNAGNLRVFDVFSQFPALTAQAAVWGRQSIAVSGAGVRQGQIAVPSDDGTIAVYLDAASIHSSAPPSVNRPLGYVSLKKLVGAKPPIYAVAVQGFGVAALGGGSLWVWDGIKGYEEPKQIPLSGVELTWTSGRTILVAGLDGSVTEIDHTTAAPIWKYVPPSQGPIEPARLSPDGRYFFANHTIWLRNKNGAAPATSMGRFETPFWAADGNRMITRPNLEFQFTLDLHENPSVRPHANLVSPRPFLATLTDLAWNHDGSSIALAAMDGSVHVQRLLLPPKE